MSDLKTTHTRFAKLLRPAVGYTEVYVNTDAIDNAEGEGMNETDWVACRVMAAFEELPQLELLWPVLPDEPDYEEAALETEIAVPRKALASDVTRAPSPG